jgi:hypothetical protein
MDAGKGLPNSYRNVISEPTKKNSPESGQIMASMQNGNGFDAHKLCDPHLDALHAVTSRPTKSGSRTGHFGIYGCGRKAMEGLLTEPIAQVEQ